MKYIDDCEEYPNILGNEILPFGILWNYVSTAFLDGIVNNAGEILQACVLTDETEEVVLTKQKELDQPNTKLSFLNKSVLLLIKLNCEGIEILDEDSFAYVEPSPRYLALWYDVDTSDCSAMRFETTDDKSEIIEEFLRWPSEGWYSLKTLDHTAFKGWLSW